MSSISFQEERRAMLPQIDAFKALVSEVNKIPGIVISLNKEEDPQRDTLAFVVDGVYRQFKANNNWKEVLKDLPIKVQSWNTPPDPFKASTALLEFVRHLFESRVFEILSDPDVPEIQKKNIQAIHALYEATVASILKHSPKDKAVSLSGIPAGLLPAWYHKGWYH